MSPIRAGRATVATVTAEALAAASGALGEAVESGGEQLPDAPRRAATDVVRKVTERSALVGGHTVVALAGATGSGKSSLFNALVGARVATVGARRPTTSTPTAAQWGSEPAGDLLDWLGVSTRHHVTSTSSVAVGSLEGLVLLDLPDFDSRDVSNRAEAERVLALVDLFVWVTDPQKYADARLHDDYVAALASHDAVMLVVLNQVDRLTPHEVEECVADLKRLLVRDGLDALGQRLANTVAGAAASRTRLAADVRSAAQRLAGGVADSEPTVAAADQHELIDALARSAGVPMVVDAVARDYRMEATGHIGWPFTRWVQAFRPRPLRRLRLEDKTIEVRDQDVRSVLGRSSIPPPSPAAKAAVALATRNLAGVAGAGLPTPWADAVDAAADPPGGSLTDDLDRAVVATPLRGRGGALVRAPVGFGGSVLPRARSAPGRWRGASALPVDRRWAGPGLVARRPVTSVRRCRGQTSRLRSGGEVARGDCRGGRSGDHGPRRRRPGAPPCDPRGVESGARDLTPSCSAVHRQWSGRCVVHRAKGSWWPIEPSPSKTPLTCSIREPAERT